MPQLAIHPQLRQTQLQPAVPRQNQQPPKLALKPVSKAPTQLQALPQAIAPPQQLQPRPAPRLGTSSSSASPPPVFKQRHVKMEDDMDLIHPPNSSMSYSLGVSPDITNIVTSKEWVLPPRPKPGRKPSNDLPPTKRKAQNRAAQRAFRERRAARVVELEDKLQEVEEEHDEVENDLRAALQNSNTENNKLRAVIEDLRSEVEMLRALKASDSRETLFGFVDANPLALRGSMFPMSERARQQRELEKEIKSSKEREKDASDDKKPVAILPKARPPKKQRESFSKPHPAAPVPYSADITPMRHDEEPDDCGLCETGGNCLCDTLGLKAPLPPDDTNEYIVGGVNLSSIKPAAAVPLKKRPASNGTSMIIRKRFKRVSEANEIDFTKTFGSKPIPSPADEPVHVHGPDCKHSKTKTPKISRTSSISSLSSAVDSTFVDKPSPAVDPCGFCSNGTPCLCAGLDEEAERPCGGGMTAEHEHEHEHEHEVIDITDVDQVTNDIAEVSVTEEEFVHTSQATSAPCLCDQDPKAKLFCTVLKSSARLCPPSKTPVLMSCTEAYHILSGHANFASCSMGSIVSTLETRDGKVDIDSLYNALHTLDKP